MFCTFVQCFALNAVAKSQNFEWSWIYWLYHHLSFMSQYFLQRPATEMVIGNFESGPSPLPTSSSPSSTSSSPLPTSSSPLPTSSSPLCSSWWPRASVWCYQQVNATSTRATYRKLHLTTLLHSSSQNKQFSGKRNCRNTILQKKHSAECCYEYAKKS